VRLLVSRGAGLIAPVDLRAFGGGPPLDYRVGLLQPLADLLGILVLGMAARHLSRIAPPLEVLADGPHGHVDPALLADQIAHSLAGPQGGRDVQVLGVMFVDLLPDAASVIIRERPAGADGAPGPVAGDRIQSTGGVSRPPAADGLTTQAEEVGHLGLGETQLTASQGAQAEGFQDVIGQLTSVGQGDSHETFLRWAKVECYHGLCEQLSCQGNIFSPARRTRRHITDRRSWAMLQYNP
jgi:hypothetical protein